MIQIVDRPAQLPLPSSSVHASETSEDLRGHQNTPKNRIHSRWRKDRAYLIQCLGIALDRFDPDGDEPSRSKLQKRADRLSFCCSWPVIRQSEMGRPVLSLGRCRDRLCPMCADCRGREVALKVEGYVKQMNAPRFITLTIATSNEPLGDQVKTLMKSFRKLRAHKYWKSHVRAGIYAIEITWHPPTEAWHPHLHIIYDGDYYPHKLLKQQWFEVTGDSFIVDVRPVHERDQAARYIARYVAKPMNVRTWPPPAVREFASAMAGKRMIHTFGKLHGATVDPKSDEPNSSNSTYVVPVRHLVDAAGAGVRAAQIAAEHLRAFGGTWKAVVGEPMWRIWEEPQLPDDEIDAAILAGCEAAAQWIRVGHISSVHPKIKPKMQSEPLFGTNRTGL